MTKPIADAHLCNFYGVGIVDMLFDQRCFLFFIRNLSLKIVPWPQPLLFLALRAVFLKKPVLSFGFFLFPWPLTAYPQKIAQPVQYLQRTSSSSRVVQGVPKWLTPF